MPVDPGLTVLSVTFDGFGWVSVALHTGFRHELPLAGSGFLPAIAGCRALGPKRPRSPAGRAASFHFRIRPGTLSGKIASPAFYPLSHPAARRALGPRLPDSPFGTGAQFATLRGLVVAPTSPGDSGRGHLSPVYIGTRAITRVLALAAGGRANSPGGPERPLLTWFIITGTG